MPKGLDCTFIVNSGSEANDLAVLMARLYTKNYTMLALQNCYHGWAGACMGLTSLQTWKYNLPHDFGIKHIENSYPFRKLKGLTEG